MYFFFIYFFWIIDMNWQKSVQMMMMQSFQSLNWGRQFWMSWKCMVHLYRYESLCCPVFAPFPRKCKLRRELKDDKSLSIAGRIETLCRPTTLFDRLNFWKQMGKKEGCNCLSRVEPVFGLLGSTQKLELKIFI